MGRRHHLAVCLCVILLSHLTCGIAAAAPGVLLGYGQTYVSDGVQKTHRGIDLAGGEDGVAYSYAQGEVTFAGRVPSDSGGSTLAVTVRCADGTLVTVHPLAECWVEMGRVVSIGEDLGSVAPSGDGSSGSQHVHVSARRSNAYVDPSFLIGTPEPVESPSAPTEAPSASSETAADPGSPDPVLAVSVPVEAVSPTSARPLTSLDTAPGVEETPEVARAEGAASAEPVGEALPADVAVVEPVGGGDVVAGTVGATRGTRSTGGLTMDPSAVRGLLAASAASAVLAIAFVSRRRACATADLE